MQAFILLTCILCGAVSGIIYDVLYIARVIVCGVDKQKYTVKDKIFTFFCDLIYFAVFALVFVYMCVCFDFYSLRLFMLAGLALGVLIYLKSLHSAIAFLIKKVYNNLNKHIRRKGVSNEGRKAQQDSGGNNR
ncbi:MAG: spore cortex biosynthesis protein YabQ [Candidatus Coproplasma sp.]